MSVFGFTNLFVLIPMANLARSSTVVTKPPPGTSSSRHGARPRSHVSPSSYCVHSRPASRLNPHSGLTFRLTANRTARRPCFPSTISMAFWNRATFWRAAPVSPNTHRITINANDRTQRICRRRRITFRFKLRYTLQEFRTFAHGSPTLSFSRCGRLKLTFGRASNTDGTLRNRQRALRCPTRLRRLLVGNKSS